VREAADLMSRFLPGLLKLMAAGMVLAAVAMLALSGRY
jgi:hypothetical protein